MYDRTLLRIVYQSLNIQARVDGMDCLFDLPEYNVGHTAIFKQDYVEVRVKKQSKSHVFPLHCGDFGKAKLCAV